MISRWENDAAVPDAMYQMLLEEVFGLPAEALGLVTATEADQGPDVHPLVSQASRRIDPQPAVLEYFATQLSHHTYLDNLAGPSYILATAMGQLSQLEQLAQRGSPEVARLTARYAEFTGWLLQDSGDPKQALDATTRAIDYANLAGDAELAAYSTMRRSNILSTLGQHQLAASTARSAFTGAMTHSESLIPVCLRQQALSFAGLKDEAGTREAIDQALALSTAAMDVEAQLSPYCTTSYLQMEAALCLLTLRQPAAAEEACSIALADWPVALVRDRTLCVARRAVALVEMRDVDEACEAAMTALDGVRSAPSGRTIHMLRTVVTRLRPYNRNAQVKQLTMALPRSPRQGVPAGVHLHRDVHRRGSTRGHCGGPAGRQLRTTRRPPAAVHRHPDRQHHRQACGRGLQPVLAASHHPQLLTRARGIGRKRQYLLDHPAHDHQ
jgi:tetratricopeptide (TPR) repeat protein